MRKIICCFALALLLFLSCAAAQNHSLSISSRGVEIPATLTLPDSVSGSCPVVLMAHGHGGSREENRGFGAIAQALADRGIASIRMDFAGCGESTEDFTHSCLTTMKEDMRSAMQFARTQLHAASIGLFGYSMGGRVVLEMLAEGDSAQAVSLLAPANDTQDLIQTAFEDFARMYVAALENGAYAHNARETLSPAWFEDLLRYGDPAREAAKVYRGPAQVVFAQDDQVVRPHVCAHVADMLGADTYDATGKGHIYGFWLEDDPLRDRIAQAIADFFSAQLFGND